MAIGSFGPSGTPSVLYTPLALDWALLIYINKIYKRSIREPLHCSTMRLDKEHDRNMISFYSDKCEDKTCDLRFFLKNGVTFRIPRWQNIHLLFLLWSCYHILLPMHLKFFGTSIQTYKAVLVYSRISLFMEKRSFGAGAWCLYM